jgi:hypothetical protein
VDGGCRTELLFTPAIDRAVPALFRRQFSVSDPEALYVVIADQAGCHLPVDDSRLPANLRRLPRPPYSPELNPVEPFGGLSKAAVSNRLDTLAVLPRTAPRFRCLPLLHALRRRQPDPRLDA